MKKFDVDKIKVLSGEALIREYYMPEASSAVITPKESRVVPNVGVAMNEVVDDFWREVPTVVAKEGDIVVYRTDDKTISLPRSAIGGDHNYYIVDSSDIVAVMEGE